MFRFINSFKGGLGARIEIFFLVGNCFIGAYVSFFIWFGFVFMFSSSGVVFSWRGMGLVKFRDFWGRVFFGCRSCFYTLFFFVGFFFWVGGLV